MKYNRIPVYLKPSQYRDLKTVKENIKEQGISIPMTEILRDSLDKFLKTHNTPESLETYLKSKGF